MINIVTIGGGTGSYTVLSGLKKLNNVSLKALVSMADNGGSTGGLRDELGVLPPGDVRQCLVALSEHSDIVRKLMNYRFSEGKLTGHSFGNILLAALEKVTGDFSKGVEIASEILKVQGDVIPITNNKAELLASFSNGKIIKGQVNIGEANFQKFGLKKIFYKNKVEISKNAKQAIAKANYIIVGPGNYYCSIIPNLIVSGFKKALKKSKAEIILPINLTNKHGQTLKWNVSDYVIGLEKYLNKKADYILVNNKPPSKQQIKRYKLGEGSGVLVKSDLKDERVLENALISHHLTTFDKNDKRQHARAFIRHDSDKLAKCIEKIIK